MTERIAYNEYAKLKDNTIITMKICPSVQDSTNSETEERIVDTMSSNQFYTCMNNNRAKHRWQRAPKTTCMMMLDLM